jgi:hypothetical protein
MDTDVLVVGAGPTGLMLANQPLRRDVRLSRSPMRAPAKESLVSIRHVRGILFGNFPGPYETNLH